MKWKNVGLWISLVSVLYLVFKDLGLQIDLTQWETYVTVIIGFLAVLGVISNPDKGRGYFDKISDKPADANSQITQHTLNQQANLPQSGVNNNNSQEIGQTQFQSEVMDSTIQQRNNNAQEQEPFNKSFDRSSIHGMPAPPNEHR